jgi:phage gp46-like protein
MADPKLYDLAVTDEGLETDEGLGTAVLLSLMTWARADAEDPVRDPKDLKGWFGNSYPDVPGDQFGSKLWICQTMPATPATLELARRYTLEALQWMIVDGIAEETVVELEIQTNVHGQKVLAGRVGIRRPSSLSLSWYRVWEVTLAGR